MKPTLLVLASALLLTVPAVAATDAVAAVDAPCYSQSRDVGPAELRLWGGHCVGVGYTIDGPAAVCDQDRVCHDDHVFELAPATMTDAAGGYCYVYRSHDLGVMEVREWGGHCVGFGYTIHGPPAVCNAIECKADHYTY